MTRGRHRITNRHLTIDGETKLLCEWAEEYGISQNLIIYRLNAGWDVETAVTKPPQRYRDNLERRDQRADDGREASEGTAP